MSYQYRCEQCRATSPPVLTRSAVALERQRHRADFHGGFTPDGESIIEPPPFHFSDIPPGQWLVGSLMILAIVVGVVIRFA
jgi:hypothetical protein